MSRKDFGKHPLPQPLPMYQLYHGRFRPGTLADYQSVDFSPGHFLSYLIIFFFFLCWSSEAKQSAKWKSTYGAQSLLQFLS